MWTRQASQIRSMVTVQRSLIESADGIRALLPVLGHLHGLAVGQDL